MMHEPNIVPVGLLNKVMSAIYAERSRRAALRNAVMASIFGVAALVSSVFVWNAFARELASSGFMEYASLAFMDIGAVIANWRDYAMSLLESFPAVNAAGLVGEAVALMVSIRIAVVYAKRTVAISRLKTAI